MLNDWKQLNVPQNVRNLYSHNFFVEFYSDHYTDYYMHITALSKLLMLNKVNDQKVQTIRIRNLTTNRWNVINDF